jgi:mRNA-degrading endonuclease RelE of RelBE toxin-antitoxin system
LIFLFEVFAASRARKSAKKLPEDYRRRIVEFLLILRENPVPAEYYDLKKLKGCTDTYRARIGDLRVIYEVLWDVKRVHVLVIEYRERAYS